MKNMLKRFRKGAEASNVALVALAIGVIIIIGMYIFTNVIGTKTKGATDNINTGLDSAKTATFTPIGK